MSTKFIIVKYADSFAGGSPHVCNSVFGSFSANECGVFKKTYASKEEAEPDLKKLKEFNPTVGYGIVEAHDED